MCVWSVPRRYLSRRRLSSCAPLALLDKLKLVVPSGTMPVRMHAILQICFNLCQHPVHSPTSPPLACISRLKPRAVQQVQADTAFLWVLLNVEDRDEGRSRTCHLLSDPARAAK